MRRRSSTVSPSNPSDKSSLAPRTLPTHVWFIDLFRGCVGKVRVAKRYPRGHVVTRPGIKCQCSTHYCGADATRCEHYRGGGVFYYCDKHWVTEGPDGTSPRDRAWISVESHEPKEVKP
jgi:hypothetical protein